MYTPREDSFLIKKHIKDFCKKSNSSNSSFSVLDIGTGSGILAQEASKYSKKVVATDIDSKTISFLKKEFKHTSKVKFLHSNLFSKINKKVKFDLIIFNPPYIPTKKINKKRDNIKYIDLDGGKNGTEIIEKFLKHAKKFLKKDGKILLLTSSLNKNIEKLFKKYNYTYIALDEEKFAFEKIFLWVLS